MLAESYKTHFTYQNNSVTAKEQKLYLQVSSYEFCFVITTNDNKIIMAQSVEINSTGALNFSITDYWEYLITNFQLTKTQFKTVKISYITKNFTLIPKAFYNTEQAKLAIQKTCSNLSNVSQYNESIGDFYLSWVLDLKEKLFLEKKFQNAQIHHCGGLTINTMLLNSAYTSCNIMLQVNVGFIEIAIKQKNLLLVYNVYSVSSTQDSLYYLLFLMQEYEINPLTCNLIISGQIATESDLAVCIKKYIKQVSFPVSPAYKINENKNAGPNHYFFNFFSE